MEQISSNELDNNSSPLSFSVELDDQPKKSKKKPPKHLLERHGKKKEVSRESINEKQRQAEDRRKVNKLSSIQCFKLVLQFRNTLRIKWNECVSLKKKL